MVNITRGEVYDWLASFRSMVPESEYKAYHLDGTATDEPAMHPVAITAVLGAASIASDGPYKKEWLQRLWDTPLRKGNRRYYDNCLYFFCFLMLSGEYKMY